MCNDSPGLCSLSGSVFPVVSISSMDAPTDRIFNACSDKTVFVFWVVPLASVLKYINQQKKNFKKKARHREWQLPQLLAWTLIKTKLVSFSEQT